MKRLVKKVRKLQLDNLQNCTNLSTVTLPLKPVLWACEFLHFPLVLMNRVNKNESVVFLYCRFSLFLRDPFFPDYLEVTTAVAVPRGVGKTSPRTSI